MKPTKYKDFPRTEKDFSMTALVKKMNEYILTAMEKPLNVINVETIFTGEGEFYLRLWYREGWEQ